MNREHIWLVSVQVGGRWCIVRNTVVFGSRRSLMAWMREQKMEAPYYLPRRVEVVHDL